MKKILFGGTTDGNLGLLLLRLYAGLAMALAHGWAKLFGGKLPGFTEMVAGMGMPFPSVMAFLAAFAECIGGFCLAIGLLTRPMAAMVAGTMAVAAFVAHGNDPFAKQELAVVYLATALFFVLKGGGKWSVDKLIG